MENNTDIEIKKLKIVKILSWIVTILIILTLIISAMILTPSRSHAISVKKGISINEIIKYQNASYKVVKIKHKNAFICPHYNYRRFYKSSDWGWLYGNGCKWINIKEFEKHKIEKQKPQRFNPAEARNYNYLNMLTSKQFKRFYQDMTDIAVMRPTYKNVARYTFMTNFMRKKSLQFAYAYYTYILDHPKYDMAAKMGTTSWSFRERDNYSLAERKQYIQRYLNKIGLFFFFSESNPYSLKQIPIINWLLTDNHIVVVGVSNDKCPANLDTKCVVEPEAFKYYNVKNLPEVIMIYRQHNGVPLEQIVGSGLTPESTLISRIFFYLHKRGKIYYKHNNYEKINGEPYMGKQ